MLDASYWHEHHWPLQEVKQWIVEAIPGATSITEPEILSPKGWGQTARFAVGGETVIFKGCTLSLYASRTATEKLLSRCCADFVPELLACKVLPNQDTWTLHRAFHGQPVDETKDFANILAMTRTLATIQTIVAEQPPSEVAALPYTPVDLVPQMLDAMIERIANGYLDAWLAQDAEILHAFALPRNILTEVQRFRPQIAQWTQEYLDGRWPVSLDHLDFNITNAVVQDDGNILIFDWEETTLSSPFFSIDRLLYDADDFEADPTAITHDQGNLCLSPNQMAIRNIYIDALTWHTRAQRERAFDLAMCLAPIKTAYECEPFNAALGREHGLPEHAARCFGRAWHVWNALQHAQKK